MQGQLLHRWARWAGDPAASIATWLWEGAPAGVSVPFALDGLMEPILDESPDDPEQLASDSASFRNYMGVESNPEALKVIESYIDNGWLKENLTGGAPPVRRERAHI